MVHETKLLTFWRALNAEMRERGGLFVDLDTAQLFLGCCDDASEAADLLRPRIVDSAVDAGLAYGWARGFDDIFAEG